MADQWKGVKRMAQQLKVEAETLVQEMQGEIYREAEKTMSESKPLVPLDEGVLRNSGHVQPPKREGPSKVSVEMGYGGPAGFRGAEHTEDVGYAVLVHEDIDTFGLSPGGGSRGVASGARENGRIFVGQAKYLETPVKKRAPGMPDRFARNIGRRIKRRNQR